jgi:hypothetical protein
MAVLNECYGIPNANDVRVPGYVVYHSFEQRAVFSH